METPKLTQLRKKSKALSPTVQIGKNGLTEDVIKEIIKQLKKRKLVKVKLVRGFVEQFKDEGKTKKDIAQEMAKKTNSEIIHQIGFMVSLWRR